MPQRVCLPNADSRASARSSIRRMDGFGVGSYARAAHVSGTVIVQVLIDETGQVIRANAISGHPLLLAAAVKAASEALFSPFTLSGQPVKVSGTIVYNFSLQ